jgi:hypothetical protein
MIGLTAFLSGIVTAAYAVSGLFFLRFWRRTQDRLFLGFAIAFGLLALNQALVGVLGGAFEDQALLYLIRLIAFLLIILSIARKNLADE